MATRATLGHSLNSSSRAPLPPELGILTPSPKTAMATADLDCKRVLTLTKAPRYLLRIVFEHLTLTDLLCVSATCKRFNRLIIQNKLTPSAGCFLLPPFGVAGADVTNIDRIHPVFGRLAIIPGKGVVRTGADDGPLLSTFKIIFATATWPPVASLQLRIIGAGPTGRYWDGRFNVQSDRGITVSDLVSGLVQLYASSLLSSSLLECMC